MIERQGEEYILTCSYCEEEADEAFDEFWEAVEYRKENGWRSVKAKNGEWWDLCPSCNQGSIIAELKGTEPDEPQDKGMAKHMADLASQDLSNFK